MEAYEAMRRIGEILAADRAAGRLEPLSHYQDRFPGGLAKVRGGADDADQATLETVRTLYEDDAQLTAVGQVLGTPA